MSGTPDEQDPMNERGPCGACGAPKGFLVAWGECSNHPTLVLCTGGQIWPLMKGTFDPGRAARGPSYSSGGEPPEPPEFYCPADEDCVCFEEAENGGEPALIEDLIAALAQRDADSAAEARAVIAAWTKGMNTPEMERQLSALLGRRVTRFWEPDAIQARHEATRTLSDVPGFHNLDEEVREKLRAAVESAISRAHYMEREGCVRAVTRRPDQGDWHATPEAAIRARRANP